MTQNHIDKWATNKNHYHYLAHLWVVRSAIKSPLQLYLRPEHHLPHSRLPGKKGHEHRDCRWWWLPPHLGTDPTVGQAGHHVLPPPPEEEEESDRCARARAGAASTCSSTEPMPPPARPRGRDESWYVHLKCLSFGTLLRLVIAFILFHGMICFVKLIGGPPKPTARRWRSTRLSGKGRWVTNLVGKGKWVTEWYRGLSPHLWPHR
jgi:hypothetical protein